ncbi:Txe/YoeB family addiction module toxin [Achromatium sp. WMS1]|nr:Txe/YoeB family addiction module toxin [Achromatium sp. WMS1]
MRSISFEGDTWQRYETLRTENKKLHQILCRILKEMQRDDPAKGTGKPEQLRYDLSGLWSRRLSQKDRLIYRFDDERIYIFAIGGHYDN